MYKISSNSPLYNADALIEASKNVLERSAVFSAGDTVFHKRYGKGTIDNIQENHSHVIFETGKKLCYYNELSKLSEATITKDKMDKYIYSLLYIMQINGQKEGSSYTITLDNLEKIMSNPNWQKDLPSKYVFQIIAAAEKEGLIKETPEKLVMTKKGADYVRYMDESIDPLVEVKYIRRQGSMKYNKDGDIWYEIELNGESYVVKKIDSTHFQMITKSNFDAGRTRGADYHISEFMKNQDFYKHLQMWLRDQEDIAGKAFIRESLQESATKYKVFHKTYTDAIQEIRDYVKKNGYNVDDDDMFRIIGQGPRKPSEGKTNFFDIPLYKNGKPAKDRLVVQVYGMKNQYELNMYFGQAKKDVY